MKAAVVDRIGAVPEYRDFPDPQAGEGEVVLTVAAVAVENVDRAIVAGTHYTAAGFQAALPAIPCFDGIGRLPDGTLVGFGGLTPPPTAPSRSGSSFRRRTPRRSPTASNRRSRRRSRRRSAR